ncbi:uncharacterized protein EI90DRAFT_3128778 [Cantharellus anzutake]|uniref:uncharacterized protein n=1 Tax=Cantharellus anzutake TaxID=1750568 RepID=UPI001903883A|nr:uncharacterized protein EI90DRAFT_3128778 [Cantharellus anzutake]KAF8325420.1 hypothetical protein EI90DRAFT_3128778 [Cantharellus anzutake]
MYDDRTCTILGIVEELQGHLKVAKQHIARLDNTALHATSLVKCTHKQFMETDSAQRTTIEDIKAIILTQDGQNVTPRDLAHVFNAISLMMEEALIEETPAKDCSVQNFTLVKRAFLDAWHSTIHTPKPSTSQEVMEMDMSIEEKVKTLQKSVDTLTVSAPPKEKVIPESKGKKRAVEAHQKVPDQTNSEPDEGQTMALVSASSRSLSIEMVEPSTKSGNTKREDLKVQCCRKRVKSKAIVACEDEMSNALVVLKKGASHE